MDLFATSLFQNLQLVSLTFSKVPLKCYVASIMAWIVIAQNFKDVCVAWVRISKIIGGKTMFPYPVCRCLLQYHPVSLCNTSEDERQDSGFITIVKLEQLGPHCSPLLDKVPFTHKAHKDAPFCDPFSFVRLGSRETKHLSTLPSLPALLPLLDKVQKVFEGIIWQNFFSLGQWSFRVRSWKQKKEERNEGAVGWEWLGAAM